MVVKVSPLASAVAFDASPVKLPENDGAVIFPSPGLTVMVVAKYACFVWVDVCPVGARSTG